MVSLKKIADDLWVADDKMALVSGLFPFGIPSAICRCSVRMTVVKLTSGGLFIHSPIPPHPELLQEIDAIGPVKFIVGPNVMHTSFLLPWKNAYPNAHLVVAPKTGKRLKQFAAVDILDHHVPLADGDLKQRLMEGHRAYETLFFHPSSKTLIATDLAYSVNPSADCLEKLWLTMRGVRNPLGVTSYNRNSVVKRDLFRKSLNDVLVWDFERIIMSHGTILEKGGREEFRRIWQ